MTNKTECNFCEDQYNVKCNTDINWQRELRWPHLTFNCFHSIEECIDNPRLRQFLNLMPNKMDRAIAKRK